jgi:serine/threonine-protein kinase haspin
LNTNEIVQPMIPLKATSKGKRPSRKKRNIVEEDSDEDRDEAEANVAEEVMSDQKLASSHTTTDIPQHKQTATRQPDYDEIDDVPLFCDGHGYDTDDEEPNEITKQSVMKHEYIQDTQKPLQESPHQDTPSISILPPTPPALDEYSEHCAALLELSSHRMTGFAEWANQLSSHFHVTKIAEASFGEVYRLSMLERISGFSSNDESVFKVIALKPPDSKLPTDKRKLNAAAKKIDLMSKPGDVANEVRLLQRMSDVPGFTNFREVRVIKGRPADPFIKAFKTFNVAQKARKKPLSEFPDPSKKASYADDQLWAVIEMQDAGTDLERLVESGECTSIWYVWDVFWQVVLSLAKGEEGVEFEHRDLHLGNICVRQPLELDQQSSNIDIKRKLHFTNLDTTIIDYTISRALMQDSSAAYKDLAFEPALFEGDSTEEYQYDIYRYMRSAIFLDDPHTNFPRKLPLAAEERSWVQYHPITNLIWLHFVLYKLIEQLAFPSAMKPPPRKNKEDHAEWKRANDLEHVLLRVQTLLEPSTLFEDELRSVSDLVRLALGEGWIDEQDINREIEWDEAEVEDALVAQFHDLELEAQPVVEESAADPEADPSRSKARTRKKKG